MNTPPTTDLLALGEVMVRLSPPGHGRLEFARTLEVDVGGGDYNVAYACARFGLRAGFVTSLPDNEVARIIRAHAGAVGLDLRHTVSGPYDGVGKNGRVGLYFAEKPPTSYAEVMACDKEAFKRFYAGMLDAGIYFAPSAFEAGFVSAAHSSEDIGNTVLAAEAWFS